MTTKKDHYQVLGVSKESTQQSIRKAFRRQAKECHPDCAGEDGADRFQELNEAHEVLSDPVAREIYDRMLGRHREVPTTQGNAPPSPSRPWRPGELIRDAFEPMAPTARTMEQRGNPFGSFFSSWPATRHRSRQVLDLALELTADERRWGARIPLVLTLPRPCPSCAGSYGAGPFGCLVCGGLGEVVDRTRLELHIPPGLLRGQVVHAKVEQPHLEEPLLLRMTVI